MSEPLQIFNRAALIEDKDEDLTYHEALAESLYLSLREAIKRINELEAKYESDLGYKEGWQIGYSVRVAEESKGLPPYHSKEQSLDEVLKRRDIQS